MVELAQGIIALDIAIVKAERRNQNATHMKQRLGELVAELRVAQGGTN